MLNTAQCGAGARLKRRGWQRAFLEALALSGVPREAARACGVHPATVYRHRLRDARFAQKWDEALREATDRLEAVAVARAVEGRKRLVISSGSVVFAWYDREGNIVEEGTEGAERRPLVVSEPSDKLLLALLAARRPAQYGRGAGAGGKGEGGPAGHGLLFAVVRGEDDPSGPPGTLVKVCGSKDGKLVDLPVKYLATTRDGRSMLDMV